jgi:hypothetical protein
MRHLIVVAGVLTLTAGTAPAAFMVELDGGDRITVDSYWEDGDRVHLLQGGVDMSVAKGRVRGVKAVDDGPPAAPAPRHEAAPASLPQPSEPPPSREDLEAKQDGIVHHLLQVQQERFEAAARGEPEPTLKNLDNEFRHTQEQRRDVARALEKLDAAK